MDELQDILQRISNYLQCPVACAKSDRYKGFFFYAFLKGRPENSVRYGSKGLTDSFNISGYDVCIETNDNGEEVYHSTNLCENVFILPVRAPAFIDTVFMPTDIDPDKQNILDIKEPETVNIIPIDDGYIELQEVE